MKKVNEPFGYKEISKEPYDSIKQGKSEYDINCTLCIYTKTKNLKDETINLLIYALSFILSFSNHDFSVLKHHCAFSNVPLESP